MANDEQWIALGKLLAAYSLLCSNISGALGYLFGGDPGSESVGVLIGHLRPPDQAHAALQLLEERSKDRNLSAKTFRELSDSLKEVMDLATNDFRVPGVDFDLALYLDKAATEDATAVPMEVWSCLNVTLEPARIEIFALECFKAASRLILAVCALRSEDEEHLSDAERSGSPGLAGVCSICMVCGQSMTTEHGGGWCTCPMCKKPFEPDHVCKPANTPADNIPS
jgi:hypothetical protein